MTTDRRSTRAVLLFLVAAVAACADGGDRDTPPQRLVYQDAGPTGGRIVQVSADGEEREVLFQGLNEFAGPLFVAPDNRILFRDAIGWLLLPAGGGTATPFTLPAASSVGEWPVWAPDGAAIAWVVSPDGDPLKQQLAIAVPGSPTYQLVTPDSLQVFRASWSPDGSRLVFGAFNLNAGASGYYTVSRTAGDLRQLSPDSISIGAFASSASWSPDGDRIAFLAVDIWTIAPDGTDIRRLTEGGAAGQGSEFAYRVHWSPDGRDLLSSVAATDRLFRIKVASGAQTNLGLASPPFDPLSPDGSRLLYVSAIELDNDVIFTVGVAMPDGSDGIQVSPDTVQTTFPAWLSEP